MKGGIMNLLSRVFLLSTLTLSLNAFANDVDTAEELYDLREENVENAVKAGEIYGTLAGVEEDLNTKADLIYNQARAVYYVGSVTEDKDQKLEIFKRCYKIAETGMKLIGDEPEDYDQEELWAKNTFYFGAGLAKWGETKGPVAAIGKWPKLRDTMESIISKGFADLEEYGANRILGRAYYKIPKIMGGSMKKSLKYLSEAFEESLADDAEVSTHGLNNLFYADVLKSTGDKEKACTILKTFIEQDPELLLDTRIPETKKEIEEAKEKIADFNC